MEDEQMSQPEHWADGFLMIVAPKVGRAGGWNDAGQHALEKVSDSAGEA